MAPLPVFSKGYGLIAQANSGLLNLVGPTEALVQGWGNPLTYDPKAQSHWVKMGSGLHETSNLALWVQHVLPHIQQDFVLLTSDGDASVPDSLNPEWVSKILAHPHLRRWYTQNLNESLAPNDPRLVSIPIGLDAHTRSDLGNWMPYLDALESRRKASPREAETGKIFIDFGINLTSPLRKELVRTLRWRRAYHVLRRKVSRAKLLKYYRRHGFVLSVRGNGHDCHRTWEALAVGAKLIAWIPEVQGLYARHKVFTVSDRAELLDPNLALRAAAHYAAYPPHVPTFRDVILEEDWPYLNWENLHAA